MTGDATVEPLHARPRRGFRPSGGRRGGALEHDGATVAEDVTDADGRVRELGALPAAGAYRITFATGAWFAATGQENFYPEVSIAFTVTDPAAHHHVPLLLAPYAYSTYRGS